MKAVVQNAYGPPSLLELKQVERPTPAEDGVLVRVHAASLHAGDYFVMVGSPYLARLMVGWPKPKGYIPGFDIAGTVEAVGSSVTDLKPGDAVFGGAHGACAEYVADSRELFVPKPAALSFEQAAAIPTSALAALQGLRDAANVQPGQHVLINGASGGVGTFAVQIAKALGAEVTGVCSTANVEMVRSLGADHVVDYTRDDFTLGDSRFDFILDNIGSRSFRDYRRVLKPSGRVLPNTGHAGMSYVLKAFVRSVYAKQQARPVVSSPNQKDLLALTELVESGRLAPVIDRVFPLDQTAEALAYVGTAHARGKVVISVM